MAKGPSVKRALIDKNNARIVIYVSVAAFIFVFSAVAVKTLLGQASYQNRVISAKKATLQQLKTNIDSSEQLKTSYNAFINTPQNVIGGNTGGTGQKDGNNAKIVLDALPSSYDFPGLTTSLETLLSAQNVKITSISGTDDEVTQSTNQSSATPQAVPIPFTVGVSGDYTGIQNTIKALERSIRPVQVQTFDLSGTSGNLTLNVTAQTYYQPAKTLNITKQVIK